VDVEDWSGKGSASLSNFGLFVIFVVVVVDIDIEAVIVEAGWHEIAALEMKIWKKWEK
jgi:hypothetical protein